MSAGVEDRIAEILRHNIPIDDRARDGRFQLVFAGELYAVVRWDSEHGWVFSSNHPLDFEPESYRPAAEQQGAAAA